MFKHWLFVCSVGPLLGLLLLVLPHDVLAVQDPHDMLLQALKREVSRLPGVAINEQERMLHARGVVAGWDLTSWCLGDLAPADRRSLDELTDVLLPLLQMSLAAGALPELRLELTGYSDAVEFVHPAGASSDELARVCPGEPNLPEEIIQDPDPHRQLGRARAFALGHAFAGRWQAVLGASRGLLTSIPATTLPGDVLVQGAWDPSHGGRSFRRVEFELFVAPIMVPFCTPDEQTYGAGPKQACLPRCPVGERLVAEGFNLICRASRPQPSSLAPEEQRSVRQIMQPESTQLPAVAVRSGMLFGVHTEGVAVYQGEPSVSLGALIGLRQQRLAWSLRGGLLQRANGGTIGLLLGVRTSLDLAWASSWALFLEPSFRSFSQFYADQRVQPAHHLGATLGLERSFVITARSTLRIGLGLYSGARRARVARLTEAVQVVDERAAWLVGAAASLSLDHH